MVTDARLVNQPKVWWKLWRLRVCYEKLTVVRVAKVTDVRLAKVTAVHLAKVLQCLRLTYKPRASFFILLITLATALLARVIV